DYFGPPLNRVARLRDAGHGGQVLISAAAAEMLADDLTNGVEFVDLGEHRLRGLLRPERVYQLVAPDLPARFPPLRLPASLGAHFAAVTRALLDGKLVLFLGTAANLCGRPIDQGWTPGRPDYLPSEGELAERLARAFDYPADVPPGL